MQVKILVTIVFAIQFFPLVIAAIAIQDPILMGYCAYIQDSYDIRRQGQVLNKEYRQLKISICLQQSGAFVERLHFVDPNE